MIKNLSIEGAGVCGIAYSGVILELDKRGIMKGLEKVAGVSAGAIVAGLISLKYNSREIYDIMVATDFKTFEDGRFLDKINVAEKYGVNPGNTFVEWMKEKITRKGLPGNATFLDFADSGMLDINVFATDLNMGDLKHFCVGKTPNVPVVYAIRASMSIPLFFQAFKFPDNNPDDHIYVDGGTVFNYPLACFDNGFENKETLGLMITDGKSKNNGLDFGHFIKYAKALGSTVLKAQNINVEFDAEDLSRTIVVNSCDVSATNFSLTTADKMKLFESGRAAVIDYFEN